MNIKLNDDIGAVKFNGAEIDLVKFNGAEVWSSGKEVSGVPPLMLEGSKGKPLKDYKIYGNSVQSSTPSADNPAEIESVGDIKNLFDLQGWYNVIQSTYKPHTAFLNKTVKDGIDCIFYRPSAGYQLKFMKGEFKEGTQYTLTWRAKHSMEPDGKISTGFSFCYTDGTHSDKYVDTVDKWDNYTLTSTAGKTIDYIYTPYRYNDGMYIDENSVQLEEGAAATEYVPYGKYVIPVEVSENVYTYESFLQSPQGNYPVEKLNDTSIHIGAWYQCIFSVSANLFKPNTTYVISKDLEVLEGTSTNVTSRIALATEKASGGFMLIEGNQTVNEFTTPGDLSGYKYLWIYGNSASINISNIEIREKESAVQTVNIVLSEPLRKIGSYADYIDFKNQKLVQYVLESPTETSMELPEIGTFSGNTLIKVKTHVQPSSVSAIYR